MISFAIEQSMESGETFTELFVTDTRDGGKRMGSLPSNTNRWLLTANCRLRNNKSNMEATNGTAP